MRITSALFVYLISFPVHPASVTSFYMISYAAITEFPRVYPLSKNADSLEILKNDVDMHFLKHKEMSWLPT